MAPLPPVQSYGLRGNPSEGDHQDALTTGRSSGQRIYCGTCKTKIEHDVEWNTGRSLQRCRCHNATWRAVPRLADPTPEPPARPVGRPKQDPLEVMAAVIERRMAKAQTT